MGEHVTGKAFDNRALVFTMVEAARRVEDPEVMIHFAGTTQEEVGLRGAEALASDLETDLAVALDVTLANDQPYYDEDDHIASVGEGTAIKVMDHSTLTNPAVYRHMEEVADQESFPTSWNCTRLAVLTPARFKSLPERRLSEQFSSRRGTSTRTRQAHTSTT